VDELTIDKLTIAGNDIPPAPADEAQQILATAEVPLPPKE
jgi:hypothetical protein